VVVAAASFHNGNGNGSGNGNGNDNGNRVPAVTQQMDDDTDNGSLSSNNSRQRYEAFYSPCNRMVHYFT